MAELSPAQVAEIRARAEKATPGPWGSKCNRKYCRDGYHAGHAVRNDRNYRKGEPMHEDGSIGQQIAEISGGGGSHKCDADFVAHARTDVPALCDSYDAQARRIEQFEAQVKEWEEREAGVCPEDYSFEEVIKQQAAEIERLKADASTVAHLRSVVARINEGKAAGAHLSDAEVAGRVRMLDRFDVDHEIVCLMGQDRIIALSDENARLKAKSADVRSILDSVSAHSPGCICEPCCKLALIQGAAK